MAAEAEALAALLRQIEVEAAKCGRPPLDLRVLQALRETRRADFVPAEERALALRNRPLPIGHAQTISQPFIVALMTDLLGPRPEHRVLEVGTGSGYQAAVLAKLVRQVCSVERIPELSARAAEALRAAGCDNVLLRVGDGALGWPEHAPYDGIIVTAAAPVVPPALVEQLAPGGRLVIPVGPQSGEQRLMLLRKDAAGAVAPADVLAVRFVPLVGAAG